MRELVIITGLIAVIGRVLPDRKKRCLSPFSLLIELAGWPVAG